MRLSEQLRDFEDELQAREVTEPSSGICTQADPGRAKGPAMTGRLVQNMFSRPIRCSVCKKTGHRKETCPAATTRTKRVRLEHVYVNSEEPALWSEQRKALSHWLEEDLSAQEIEELKLIKAMVIISPMILEKAPELKIQSERLGAVGSKVH